jgi:class 3 adenylate cyclase
MAVTYPERVSSLTLYGTQACFHRTDDYPWGDPEYSFERALEEIEQAWGSLGFAEIFAPSGDERFGRQWAAYQRAGASPSAAAALGQAHWAIDVRPLLGAVRAPTLVLSRRGDPVGPPDAGQYMAKLIPGARFIELAGDDHVMWLGDVEALCGEIEQFITGLRPAVPEPGSVTTILHCDIEGSTLLARQLGDERWADLLAHYDHVAEVAIAVQGGRVVDRTGDGLMASFPGPVAAIRAAQRLQQEASDFGVRIRAGIHIGEVLERNGSLRGIAVHVAARVMAEAAGGEVLVSQTVKDIVAGSGLRFVDRGLRQLKGIEGEWRIFAVAQ